MRRVTAFILAAGTSSRMVAAGFRPKLLLPWGNNTVLCQTIQNVQAVFADVIVVTGAYADETRKIAAACGVSTVHNFDYTTGEMISSLQAGLRETAETGGFLVMLGDMPLVRPETMWQITAFWEEHGGIVAPMFGGKRGHPVIFSAEYRSQLLALSWQETPRAVIQANRSAFHLLPVETESVLIDLDTPESYQRWYHLSSTNLDTHNMDSII